MIDLNAVPKEIKIEIENSKAGFLSLWVSFSLVISCAMGVHDHINHSDKHWFQFFLIWLVWLLMLLSVVSSIFLKEKIRAV